MAEDTNINFEITYSSQSSLNRQYKTLNDLRFTIKPSEPTYEWQWKWKTEASSAWEGFTDHVTDDEHKMQHNINLTYERDESTKRIRS
jgi:hypothetical protein